MNITIHADWWMLPAVVTAVAFTISSAKFRKETACSSNFMGTDVLLFAFYHGAALIVSLTAWLIWAVLT